MKTIYTKNSINYKLVTETVGTYPFLNRFENGKLVFSCFLKDTNDILETHIQRRFELISNGYGYDRVNSDNIDILNIKLVKRKGITEYIDADVDNRRDYNWNSYTNRLNGNIEKTMEILNKI